MIKWLARSYGLRDAAYHEAYNMELHRQAKSVMPQEEETPDPLMHLLQGVPPKTKTIQLPFMNHLINGVPGRKWILCYKIIINIFLKHRDKNIYVGLYLFVILIAKLVLDIKSL